MQRIRILILEDDADIIDLVSSALGSNYECYAAANGLEGMQLAQLGEPDLIICDIMMPVMDGWEFVRRLRKFDSFEKTPVIFLTALTSRDQIRNGYQMGAGLYLTKPIDPIRLKRNIELYLSDHAVQPRSKSRPIEDLLISDRTTTSSTGSSIPKAPPPVSSAPPRPEMPPVAPPQPTPAPPPPTPSPAPMHTPAPDATGGVSNGETTSKSMLKSGIRPVMPKDRWRKPDNKSGESEKKVRILVVEDDPDTLQMIMSGISQQYEVIQSTDGITAIEMGVRYKPDIFVIDGLLPKMTGYQLTIMLRKNYEFYKTPIIFISGKSSVRDQQYAQKLGANEFLAKPFKISDLQKLITHIIDHPKFSIRTDRVSMGQAYLEQIQHKETHRSEPVTNIDQLERRHLENVLKRQLQ